MLQWTESLRTGNARIDAEHREIMAQLNEIGGALQRGADPEALTKLITVLLDYAYLHFHHEEHAMSCAGCPMLGKNCAAHRFFAVKMKTWLAVINSGVAPISLISDIHTQSCDWIKSHIEKVDIGLRSPPPAPTDAVAA
jgi:hemerythrin-like metal-binding protein